MLPDAIAAYAALITAIITAIGVVAGGTWTYLYQRAKLREERDARLKSEASAAKKDELDALRAIINELREELERKEKRILELENELLELRGHSPRKTGTLKLIL